MVNGRTTLPLNEAAMKSLRDSVPSPDRGFQHFAHSCRYGRQGWALVASKQ
jgi:hypothetical protein